MNHENLIPANQVLKDYSRALEHFELNEATLWAMFDSKAVGGEIRNGKLWLNEVQLKEQIAFMLKFEPKEPEDIEMKPAFVNP